MTANVELRPAEPTDRPYVDGILEANGLPTDDLPDDLEPIYVCERSTEGAGIDKERIGIGGLEQYGETALLRSVAVGSSARGEGYGTAICEELLDHARVNGISQVYLLTTTADSFFADLGFEEVDRESAPEAIQNTDEFSELCPSTAVCMKRDLD